MTVPSVQAVKVAFHSRLAGDAPLSFLVLGVFNGGVPAEVDGQAIDWSLPVLEYGVQGDVDDPANGYGQDGLQLVFRLMAHDRGSVPGVGAFNDCYAALEAAHTALTATPLTVAGQTLWRFKRTGGVPEANPPGEGGFRYYQTGALYELRTL